MREFLTKIFQNLGAGLCLKIILKLDLELIMLSHRMDFEKQWISIGID